MTVAPLLVPRAALPLWRRAAAPRPLPTAWPAIGWVALLVLTVALVQEGGCSAEDPCVAAPLAGAVEGFTFVGPFLLWLLPWCTRVVALLLASAWTFALLVDSAGLPVPELLVAVAGLTGWSLVVDRVQRAREQEAQELAAAAPQALWPGPVPPVLAQPSWLEGRRIALALLVLAALLVAFDLQRLGSAQQEEAQAARADAVVVEHGDDGYLITLQVAGRQVEVDTTLAEQYPVGSTQPVLLVGDDVRLVAEPHAPFAAQALGEVLAAAGVVVGLRGRRRIVRLHHLLTRPQPVLGVQARPYDGDALLLASDAGELEGPALAVADVVAWNEDDEDDDERELPQQLVTAYGLPLPGHPVALVTREGLALLPLGPARRPPDLVSLPFRDVLLERPAAPVEVRPGAAQALDPDRGAVLLGQLLAAAALPALALVVATADSALEAVLRTLMVLNLGVGGLLRATSGVQLHDDALVVTGPLRHRRLPWWSLRAADVVAQDLVVLTRDGEAVPLPVPPPALVVLRRHARRERLRDATAVLQTRIALAGSAGVEEVAASRVAPLYAAAAAVALLVGLVLR